MSRWKPISPEKVLDHLRVSRSLKKTAIRFRVSYERIRQIARENGCEYAVVVPPKK